MKRSRDHADDTLTPAEARLVRHGEAEFKRGESKPWQEVKNTLIGSLPSVAARKADSTDARKLIIPTLHKEKISQSLSYPVGAKDVSEALVSVPQFGDLQLNFWTYQFRNRWPSGDYVFLRVGAAPFRQTQGEIEVQPVPRVMRHRFHEYIVGTALAQMAKWLVEGAAVAPGQEGSLVFSYDEKGDEFITQSFASRQSLRI